MDVASLKSCIKTNELPNLMIFAGEEWEVQKIYIQQIQKVIGLEQKRVDSVTDILSSLRTKSVIGKSYLYIVRDDKLFMTDEKLQARTQNLLNSSDNRLILLVTKLDKRTKFYNKNKGIIVEFEAFPPMILEKYIKKHINLSEQNCNRLIEVCESNYGRILLEIDKIKNYDTGVSSGTEDNELYDLSFKSLLANGVIYQPPKDAIFDLVEAILKRDFEQSIALLKESYASGEATMVMLSVLFTNAKAVLQVQSCTSKEVGKTTGLSGFQIMNANKVKGHYKISELEYMLQKIQDVELGIKTGRIEDRFAVEYLLVEVM